MSRISASGTAMLFKGISPGSRLKSLKPKKSGSIPESGMLPELIFSHGHVQEHNALTIVGKNTQETHGQNAYARDLDHIDSTAAAAATCETVEDIVALLKKKWLNSYMRLYAEKLGNEGRLALEELSVVGECIQSIKNRLRKSPSDIFNIVKEEAVSIFGRQHTFSNGIVYDVPRYKHDINGISVVCQPDGTCVHENKLSIVEIKSSYGSMYTSKSSLSASEKTITANANIGKWLQYLIQVAIEMFPTEMEGAMFVCFQGSKIVYVNNQTIKPRTTRAKYIYFTRPQMSELINAVRSFIAALAPDGEVVVAVNSTSPYDLYARLDTERQGNALTLYKNVYTEVINIYNGLEKTADGDVWNEWEVVERGSSDDSSSDDSSSDDSSDDDKKEQSSSSMHVICNNMHSLAPNYRFNTEMTFERDPDNAYDKHAIKVMANGRQIAWVASAAYIAANISNKFALMDIYANSSLFIVLDTVISVEFVKRKGGAAILKVLY